MQSIILAEKDHQSGRNDVNGHYSPPRNALIATAHSSLTLVLKRTAFSLDAPTNEVERLESTRTKTCRTSLRRSNSFPQTTILE